MIRTACIATTMVALVASAAAASERHGPRLDANGNLDGLIARHAAANHVPEALVRRIIRRESRGNPRAVHAGNYGLMQIRLGTARAMGYRGSARGLLDPETNMTYAVKYLAGAYRAARGNFDRAVHNYAAGYYHAAKRERVLEARAASSIGAFAAVGGTTVSADAVKHSPRARHRAGVMLVNEAKSSGESVDSGRLDRF